jgi:hypothetical protein
VFISSWLIVLINHLYDVSKQKLDWGIMELLRRPKEVHWLCLKPFAFHVINQSILQVRTFFLNVPVISFDTLINFFFTCIAYLFLVSRFSFAPPTRKLSPQAPLPDQDKFPLLVKTRLG